MVRHVKKHDKDKYYFLAKEQGYRSRAAFKLIQINKKYEFLQNARVCVDLCAAPGGWCQVAAKSMPTNSIIIGVDLLPIRPIRNVKTLQMDITSGEFRAALKKELQTWKVDIVLCDGAPNIGTAYNKDAYVQNELALAALRVATEHLAPKGTFVTKVYRSQDYNSLLWVANQLFAEVNPVKPSSSRSQSAEIFLVCLGYKAPHTIDPKLLNPKFVFEHIDDAKETAVNIFHKNYEKIKRKRHGYDNLDETGTGLKSSVSLHRQMTVSEFIHANEPGIILAYIHKIFFSDACQLYEQHSATDDEIKNYLQDIQVLGKKELKIILKWRRRMQKYSEELVQLSGKPLEPIEEKKKKDEPLDEEYKDTKIQEEIEELEHFQSKELRKLKKKDRKKKFKLRARQALNIDHDAIDLPVHEELFALPTTGEVINSVAPVENYEPPSADDNEEGEYYQGSDDNIDDDDNVDNALEKQLELAYLQTKLKKSKSLSNQKDIYDPSLVKDNKSISNKPSRENMRNKALGSIQQEMQQYDGGLQQYIELLSRNPDGSSDDSDTDDEDTDEDDEEEVGNILNKRSITNSNDGDDSESDEELLSNSKNNESKSLSMPPVSSSAASARWFSNSLFDDVEAEVGKLTDSSFGKAEKIKSLLFEIENDSDNNFDDDNESDGYSDDEEIVTKQVSKKAKLGNSSHSMKKEIVDPEISENVQQILSEMPKTDKEIRKEKRKKLKLRKEKKELKKSKRDAETEENDNLESLLKDSSFDIVPESPLEDPQKQIDIEKQKALDKKKRELIRAGMGLALLEGQDSTNKGFDIDPINSIQDLKTHDTRSFNSDDENYTLDQKIQTLAIATMMLRKSKAKQLVDASYNRYAYNDTPDLPKWFLEEENVHNRPQLPIPQAILDKLKQKFIALTEKPMKKVAEARARKRKRLTQRMESAKKKAQGLIENPDLNEKQKARIIQKTMAKSQRAEKPSKVYVVSKKGGGKAGGNSKSGTKGRAKVKLVDSRLKADRPRSKRKLKDMKRREKGKSKRSR